MHGEVDGDLEQEAAARRQVRIRGRLAYMLEPVERGGKIVAAARSRKYHGGFSRRPWPSGEVVLTRRPARHAGEPAATVRHRMVRRKTWRGKHAALGFNKAKRKGRLGLLRIRVDKFHKSARWGGGETTSSQETGVTVAKASIGAAEEFPEGKPYRVDAGPNAARKRARDTMAPLNNKTQHPRIH
jgi:hypothetical protein